MAQNSKSILEIWPLNHLSMYLRLPGARCWKHVPDIRYQNKVLCRGKIPYCHWNQSHYREVPRWEIFGLNGSTEAKGSGPIMSNFVGWFFHIFRGKKMIRKFIFFKVKINLFIFYRLRNIFNCVLLH